MAARKPAINTAEDLEDTETEGESEPEPEDSERWLPKQSASALTGIEHRRLHYLGESRQVRRRKNAKGEWEYALSDLEPFQESKEQSFTMASRLVEQATRHTESAFKLVFDPAKELFTLLRDENVSLRESNAKLTQTHLDLIKAQEALLSEAHERELAARESAAAIERKTEMLNLGKKILPVIAAQMAGISPSALDPKLAATVEFLKTVDRSKVELMLGSDFLSDTEKSLLRKAMGIDDTVIIPNIDENGNVENNN